jgi:hypoxanthine phosphoribosyltransferase
MNEIVIKGRRFRKFIDETRIKEAVKGMAERMSADLKNSDEVLFIGILNGAFLFAADLFRQIELQACISFLKLASYEGTTSSGSIKELIGWNEDVRDKTVVIIEDIVDTGETLEIIMGGLRARKAKEIKVATLLFKPESYKGETKPDYAGFIIPKEFVVGYGLDYDGYGRNLPAIYSLVE